MTDSTADIRQNPTPEFIEQLRARFPTETEIDAVLTRKMQNRAARQEAYTPVTLEELVAGTHKLLEQKVTGEFSLEKPRWLSGGASMLQMAFELHCRGDLAGESQVTPMVLRMSPMEPVVETSFLRESEIVNLVKKEGILPVPQCYWIDEVGEFLPYPAIVYGFVTGVAKPTAISSTQVTGVGLNFGPELRQKLAPQALKQIADLHRFDASKVNIAGFDKIEAGSNANVIKEINWWHRVWEEDRGEEEPLLQMAANWLKRNAPVVDHVSILHNDLRSGNFLFDEDKAEISSWLDWELVSLGDRHQDLGWLLSYHFGHFAEDGQTFLASGLWPVEEFYRQYEQATGLPLDPQRIKYYKVLNNWKSCIIVMGTGYRVCKGSKSHQDVVVSWLSAIGYLVMEGLREALEEAMA